MEYQKLLKLSYIDDKKYMETYKSRINNECATILDVEISGNKAFYLTNQEMLMLITKTSSVDREISLLVSKTPEIAIKNYTYRILIDEIQQTNEIENVYSTKKQIKDTFDKITKNKNSGRFNGLIKKYLFLMNNEEIHLKTCEDIRHLYDDLVLKEVSEEDKTNIPDGLLFRKDFVSIYSDSGKEIHVGVFPEQKIISCLSSALAILNNENINYLISTAIFHYLFAYIHPFYDGNGRTDRFISSYYISKYLNPLVAYRLSYVIKKHKSQYYKMFVETNDKRNKGDLTPFIIQFLELVLDVEKELLEELKKLNAQLNYYNEKLSKFQINEFDKNIAYLLLLSALFSIEGLSITQLIALTDKTYNTIKKSIVVLTDKGLLRITKKSNEILYEIDLDALQ